MDTASVVTPSVTPSAVSLVAPSVAVLSLVLDRAAAEVAAAADLSRIEDAAAERIAARFDEEDAFERIASRFDASDLAAEIDLSDLAGEANFEGDDKRVFEVIVSLGDEQLKGLLK